MRLEGKEAIEYAEANDLTLCKYEDPIEEAREDLTINEARKVVREDPRLVYVDVPSSKPIVDTIEAGLKAGGDESNWDDPEFEQARKLTEKAGCVWDFDGWLNARDSIENGMLGGVQFVGSWPSTGCDAYKGI